MPEPIDMPDLNELFATFAHTAWRLETQRGYEADQKSERYRRWARGEGYDAAGREAFLAGRRKPAEQGKRVERVRIVDDPPTENQRYLLVGAPVTIGAGEDIRHLWRSDAERLDLPPGDFWLFDSRTLVRFRHDGGRTLGLELTTAPAEVLKACQVRDAAWHYAIPHEKFVRQVPPAR
ncbi:DUF6879 family protein [Streptomyces sp. NPDC049881]|uniref:DUF6879 family protein n=1 Tax=Streptomyces sp. NPDC049881 TaxID=3155778 RepID=UPI00343CF124